MPAQDDEHASGGDGVAPGVCSSNETATGETDTFAGIASVPDAVGVNDADFCILGDASAPISRDDVAGLDDKQPSELELAARPLSQVKRKHGISTLVNPSECRSLTATRVIET